MTNDEKKWYQSIRRVSMWSLLREYENLMLSTDNVAFVQNLPHMKRLMMTLDDSEMLIPFVFALGNFVTTPSPCFHLLQTLEPSDNLPSFHTQDALLYPIVDSLNNNYQARLQGDFYMGIGSGSTAWGINSNIDRVFIPTNMSILQWVNKMCNGRFFTDKVDRFHEKYKKSVPRDKVKLPKYSHLKVDKFANYKQFVPTLEEMTEILQEWSKRPNDLIFGFLLRNRTIHLDPQTPLEISTVDSTNTFSINRSICRYVLNPNSVLAQTIHYLDHHPEIQQRICLDKVESKLLENFVVPLLNGSKNYFTLLGFTNLQYDRADYIRNLLFQLGITRMPDGTNIQQLTHNGIVFGNRVKHSLNHRKTNEDMFHSDVIRHIFPSDKLTPFAFAVWNTSNSILPKHRCTQELHLRFMPESSPLNVVDLTHVHSKTIDFINIPAKKLEYEFGKGDLPKTFPAGKRPLQFCDQFVVHNYFHSKCNGIEKLSRGTPNKLQTSIFKTKSAGGVGVIKNASITVLDCCGRRSSFEIYDRHDYPTQTDEIDTEWMLQTLEQTMHRQIDEHDNFDSGLTEEIDLKSKNLEYIRSLANQTTPLYFSEYKGIKIRYYLGIIVEDF